MAVAVVVAEGHTENLEIDGNQFEEKAPLGAFFIFRRPLVTKFEINPTASAKSGRAGARSMLRPYGNGLREPIRNGRKIKFVKEGYQIEER